MTREDSIFKVYFQKNKLIDRKELSKEEGVDVIVPIINTNELFESNLFSWYRNIPINTLYIGYGGGTDNSLEILKKFPRVVIIDQSKKYSNHLYGSQGICIAELMSLVETEWFIYLHGDVFIPESWFDIMKSYQSKYDWYESNSHITSLIEFDSGIKNTPRAYSGGQMGRKEAFINIIPIIEDDYVQNNEDIIFAELILQEGFRYGRVLDTFYYHQVMNKRGEKEPKLKSITVEREKTKEWAIKIHTAFLKGIIKYCTPKPYLIVAVDKNIKLLQREKALDINKFLIWVEKTNRTWIKHIKGDKSMLNRLLIRLQNFINSFFNIIISKSN